ncbi:MAG: M23 family metallopeptidase [Henriciella sp.]
MIKKHWGLMAVSALALAACDVVRVPGDGREPPQSKPVVPDGAPGPAPPTVPVNDPWDEDQDGDVQDIPVTNTDIEDSTDPVDADAPIDDPDADTVDDAVDNDPVDPDPDVTDQPDPGEDDATDTPDPDISAPNSDEPSTDVSDTTVDELEDETPTVSPPPPPPPAPVKFEYYAPGSLIPGTGFGLVDDTIYAPDMLFPIKSAPTFPQSMVYRLGGAVGGDQCDPENYSVPWRDNFCEKRTSNRNTPLCPTNKVHQGQDIRVGSAADCNALRQQSPSERGLHEVIAVEDGIIQHIGTYSVKLKGTETGNIYSYLHLNMRRLRVSALDTVSAGDTIGFVSNDFGGTPTTFHLHFEMKAPLEGEGIVHVPPYMSLVAAYERREGGIGKIVEDDLVAVASAPVIVDESKLIE